MAAFDVGVKSDYGSAKLVGIVCNFDPLGVPKGTRSHKTISPERASFPRSIDSGPYSAVTRTRRRTGAETLSGRKRRWQVTWCARLERQTGADICVIVWSKRDSMFDTPLPNESPAPYESRAK